MVDIAIVTGGTRGIGRAIAERFNENGYLVVSLFASNVTSAKLFSDETSIASMQCDVSNFTECKKTVEKIYHDFGPVSVLVNNAGIIRDSMFHKMNERQWTDVINTNLNGVFNMTKCVWSQMRTSSYGRVINISSINGQDGQAGQANYSASKAAVLGLTKTLALEGARSGITVNAIAPGYIATDMLSSVDKTILDNIISQIPVGRLGKPSEIARTALFLASRNAGFITGATLPVNGAQYLT